MKALFIHLIWTFALTMLGPASAQSANNASGVFVTQIGSGNQATVSQDERAVSGFAKIEQTGKGNEGEGNVAALTQGGGEHWAQVTQSGTKNTTGLTQQGNFESRAIIRQTGQDNLIGLTQTSEIASQFATLTQIGEGNIISLSQEGTQNVAELTQTGDKNRMNLSQTGGGNVTWIQDGNGLAPVELAVGGAQVMILTQTKP